MREIRVTSDRRTQVIDITDDVRAALRGVEGAAAVLVYVPHTTAGVTINEDADPALARDIEAAMERIVADSWGWQHADADGPNAPSHVRASLLSPQVLIPLDAGRLALGTWQGIYLCEHRSSGGPRRLIVTAFGEPS